MVLRIYYGNHCEDIVLTSLERYSIGQNTKAGFDISAPDLKPEHIVLKRGKDGWKLVCNGAVKVDSQYFDKKKQYESVLEPYNHIILSSESLVSCLVLDSDVRQTRFNIAPYDSISIGRENKCNITLKYAMVSSSHAFIRKCGMGYELVDDHSTNGTYVNGTLVTSALLKNGDKINIGEATLMFGDGFLDIQSNFCSIIRPQGTAQNPLENVVKFERSPRLKLSVPQGEVDIQAPPSVGSKPTVNWVQVILPSLGTVGVSAVVTVVSGMNPMMLAFSAPMAVIGIIVSIINYLKQSKGFKRQEEKRLETYTTYLESVISNLESKRGQQVLALTSADPSTEDCFTLVQNVDKTLWDRRPSDADFMSFRIGAGDGELSVEIKIPQKALSLEEDTLQNRAAEIRNEYKIIHDLPVICSAQAHRTVGIVGSVKDTVSVLSSIIVQVSTHHSYLEAKLILFCNAETLSQIQWVKNIPHFYDDERKTTYIASDKNETEKLCSLFEKTLKERQRDREEEDKYERTLKIPFLVFIIADPSMMRGETIRKILFEDNRDLGICTLMLYERVDMLPKECGSIIELKFPSCEFYSKERASDRVRFHPDAISKERLSVFSRAMWNIECDEASAETGITKSITLFEVLGINSVRDLDLHQKWESADIEHTLSAPLGVKEKNELVCLDLHENAHGPHGLVAGTTGSGKSEVLQSYILAMAANYHPYEVGFVIIDFKGGGMANQFRDLPHLVGAITDIDGREIDRSLQSIKAELDKRKRLFAENDVNRIDQYIELFQKKAVKVPLPHLIIIVDEFAELKADQPEFMQELISAARIGRSLGVHLILATQKPAGQVNEQIWSNSKFKLCLKVQDVSDSKEVLKSPLAAKIKNPGRAYLKVGNDEIFELFQSGYSGAMTQYEGERVSELTALVRYIAAWCEQENIKRLPPICLPPLPAQLDHPGERIRQALRGNLLPIGIYDAPSLQEQGICRMDMSKNSFIVGAAQTGKTNLLQGIIRSVALCFSPSQVNLYILDFGSMTLKTFEPLRHVGGVVLPDEDEKLKNLFKLLNREIEQRKKKLLSIGVSSFQAYQEGGYGDMPQIMVLLDGFAAFHELYGETYEPDLQHICRDGLAYGISVIITNTQTGGFGYKFLTFFSERFAFACNDPGEYSNVFAHCRMELPNVRGRLLCQASDTIMEAQAFLAFQGEREIERAASLRAFVEAANKLYSDERAAAIPAIPARLSRSYIAEHYAAPQEKYEYILGLDYADVERAICNFGKVCELGILGSTPERRLPATERLLTEVCGKGVAAPVQLYVIDSVERPLKKFKDNPAAHTYSIDFGQAGEIIDDIYDAFTERYDVLVNESMEALEHFPLLLAVFNNRAVIEFISGNKDLMEKYKKIVKQAKSLKIAFVFSDLDCQSVPFGAPELLKLLKGLKDAVITDNLKEVQFFDIPSPVVRGSKRLQKGDAFYMSGGDIKRIKLCEDG